MTIRSLHVNRPAITHLVMLVFLSLLTLTTRLPLAAQTYFPPPDSQGGWRMATTAEEVRRLAGLDLQ